MSATIVDIEGGKDENTGAQKPPTTFVSVSSAQPLQSMLLVTVSAELVRMQPMQAGR